jgi:hypothetical protein
MKRVNFSASFSKYERRAVASPHTLSDVTSFD